MNIHHLQTYRKNLHHRIHTNFQALYQIQKKMNLTVVMITHDRQVAEQADRIVHIIDGVISEDKQEVER